MNKRILIDCDGVLLNWVGAFEQFMTHRGYPLINPNAYSISDSHCIELALAEALVRQFNASARIGFLEPMSFATSVVKRLAHSHGYRFVVISSFSDDTCAHQLRADNLLRIFGPVFDDLILLDCGADKREALAKFKHSNMIWIEDKLENAEVGASLGLKSFLLTQPYNLFREPVNCTRCADWFHLESQIREGLSS